MTGQWQPKYKCICSKCGWIGKRTLSTMHYLCPKCNGYPVKTEDEMGKRKPYNDKAGYIASRRNNINRGWVVIYITAEQGIDCDNKYAVVCEKHNVTCSTTSIKRARPFLKYPGFCEACMTDFRNEADDLLSKSSLLQSDIR